MKTLILIFALLSAAFANATEYIYYCEAYCGGLERGPTKYKTYGNLVQNTYAYETVIYHGKHTVYGEGKTRVKAYKEMEALCNKISDKDEKPYILHLGLDS